MKKIILLSLFLITLAITFFACSEERNHANPYDPQYWENEAVQPRNLCVEYYTINAALIRWDDNSVEEKFIIERKLITSSDWEKVGDVQGDDAFSVEKSFVDTVEIGVTYNYRVFAMVSNLKSDYTETNDYIHKIPIPTNFKAASINETSIILSWSENINDEEGFIIDKKETSDSEWILNYAVLPNNTLNWIDSTLTTGNIYFYRIQAYNLNYTSDYTDEVQAVPQIATKFIRIESGSFEMGGSSSSNSLPVHEVLISKDYYICKYEVTQEEWSQFMPESIYNYGKGNSYPVYYISWAAAIVYCNKRSISEGLPPCYSINGSSNPDEWGELPISNSDVVWDSIICDWDAYGYRLPSEAEWEYAAKGGMFWQSEYIYSGSNSVDAVAWYRNNSNNSTHIVGTKAKNQVGAYDMSGNSAEWCWDRYSNNYYQYCIDNGIYIDPRGPNEGSYRVFRGGSWGGYDFELTNNYRDRWEFAGGLNGSWVIIGFRLARTSE